MRAGEFDHRLSLRKKDYLKRLAGSIKALRDDVQERQTKVDDLLSCIDEGDLDGAKELASQLRIAPVPEEGVPEEKPEEKKEEEKPAEQPEAVA